jgi:hypothetical protein
VSARAWAPLPLRYVTIRETRFRRVKFRYLDDFIGPIEREAEAFPANLWCGGGHEVSRFYENGDHGWT